MSEPEKIYKVPGIRCSNCWMELWSRYGHDFRHCWCGATFVDGGPWYLRYGWDDKYGGRPRQVLIEVPESELSPQWRKKLEEEPECDT